jgi:hypothetical protein
MIMKHRTSATTCRYVMEYKSVIQNLGKGRSGDGGGVEEACKCDEGLEHEVVEGRYRSAPASASSQQVRDGCFTG